MNEEIFKNPAAQDFFAQTVLGRSEPLPALERLSRGLCALLAPPLSAPPARNVCLFSHSDAAMDFAFAIAAAAALAGKITAFCVPTPQDFCLQQLLLAPGACAQQAAAEREAIAERLLICRQGAPLAPGVQLAVFAPLEDERPRLPFVGISYCRQPREGCFCAELSPRPDGLLLRTPQQRFFYAQNPQQRLQFRPSKTAAGADVAEFLASHRLAARSGLRAQELAGFLALGSIDGFGLGAGSALAVRVGAGLLKIDLSAMNYAVQPGFALRAQPSF